jgi:uncharacterized membrane protein YccC
MVMKSFAAFEDSALRARLERLRRAELDLNERIQRRLVQAESEGRWVPSDPMYQRLASVLRQVRSDLRETEQEHLRRTSGSASRQLAAA